MEILDEEVLLSHSAFIILLKKVTSLKKSKSLIKKVLMEKKSKSIRDIPIFYNICDCQPFTEALSKLLVPYLEESLDIFKTLYLVSDVAKILMIKKIQKVPFFAFVLNAMQICKRK